MLQYLPCVDAKIAVRWLLQVWKLEALEKAYQSQSWGVLSQYTFQMSFKCANNFYLEGKMFFSKSLGGFLECQVGPAGLSA